MASSVEVHGCRWSVEPVQLGELDRGIVPSEQYAAG